MPPVTEDGDRLAALLKAHRREAGLTQGELARRTRGRGRTHIAAYEAGRSGIPRRSIAVQLAAALGLDPFETDRFLHVSGFATVFDWQRIARALLDDPGIGAPLADDILKRYLSKETPPDDDP